MKKISASTEHCPSEPVSIKELHRIVVKNRINLSF
jgi:hypothetical protein